MDIISTCRKGLIAKSKSHSAIGHDEDSSEANEQTDLFRVTEEESNTGLENSIIQGLRRSQTQVCWENFIVWVGASRFVSGDPWGKMVEGTRIIL